MNDHAHGDADVVYLAERLCEPPGVSPFGRGLLAGLALSVPLWVIGGLIVWAVGWW